MSVSHVRRIAAGRSVRTLGFAAVVTASIPLCLTGCAAATDTTVHAAELYAAPDSDLLQLPAERVYDVAETALRTPVGGALTRAIESQIESSGYLVLKDGVITEGQINVAVADFPEGSFELSQPTVLRREGSTDTTVYAIGTLTVNGVERPGITLQLTPTELTKESVEFDVDFSIPDNPLLAGKRFPLDELSAHLVLTAR
ncbi:YceI family protein [Leucobacter luti]|uniref:YceI-like domain-containing protein n=1 Tax=Leucobacter luti TaxID=340320 RepID=A0A4Q7TZB0_9MICO|nr:YceI family protein [Leucobacter luti]MBL3698592.1 YceI family protein [Leucobacter luti]RZT65967.1 hypothetical protein EV139_1391 [Leucobacter luti]